ncbi:MAG: hypothetical protein R3C11_14615 [Planctomycetaceae bacterium]
MKLLLQSRITRRVLICVVVLVLVKVGLYVEVKKRSAYRKLLTDYMPLSTTIYHNPWGIKPGMHSDEATRLLGSDLMKGQSLSIKPEPDLDITFQKVEYGGLYWDVSIGGKEETKDQEESFCHLEYLSVRPNTSETWLEWLWSCLHFW